MARFAVRMIGWLLGRNLSDETRAELVVHILRVLHAVPLRSIIDTNEHGELTISGRTLDIEQASHLRAHARIALENKALNLIREQVMYESFVGAAMKSATPGDMTFYRAALWWGQQVETHLTLLAGSVEPADE